MHGKRWFFFLLVVLLGINLAYFYLSKHSGFKDWLRQKTVDYISYHLNTEIVLESFEVNDKQIRATGVSIGSEESSFQIDIHQLYINYNFFKLIFPSLRLEQALESIVLIEPVININVHENNEKKEPSDSFDTGSLAKLFKTLYAANGEINVNYDSNLFSINDRLFFNNLSIVNDTDTEIAVLLTTGRQDNSEELSFVGGDYFQLNFSFDGDKLKQADFESSGYPLPRVESEVMHNLSSFLNIRGVYAENKLRFEGELFDIELAPMYDFLPKEHIFIPELSLFSDGNTFYLKSDKILYGGSIIELNAVLNDYLTGVPNIDAEISAAKVAVNKYYPASNGFINGFLTVRGRLEKPDIEIKLNSEKITINNEDIKAIDIVANYYSEKTTLELRNAVWQDNILRGTGAYYYDGSYDFKMVLRDFRYQLGYHSFGGDIDIDLDKSEKLSIQIKADNAFVESNSILLNSISLTGQLNNSAYSVNGTGNRIAFDAEGDLKSNTLIGQVKLSSYDTGKFFKNNPVIISKYPYLSGTADIKFLENILNIGSVIRIINPIQGDLEGIVHPNIFINFEEDYAEVKVNSENMRFHREPFSFDIDLAGNSNRLISNKFSINDEINGELTINDLRMGVLKDWVDFPTFGEVELALNLKTENINARKYMQYVNPKITSNVFFGKINSDIRLKFPGSSHGTINISEFSYGELAGFHNYTEFKAELFPKENEYYLEYESRLNTYDDVNFLSLKGKTDLQSNLDTSIKGNVSELSLDKIFTGNELSGVVSADLNYQRLAGEEQAELFFSGKNIRYPGISSDSLKIVAVQKDSLLVIKELESAGLLNVSAKGNLNLNLLSGRIYDGSDTVNLNLSGDIIRYLTGTFNEIENGTSNTNMSLEIGVKEDELNIVKGLLEIKGNGLRIKNQPERFDDIDIYITVDDDKLFIERFQIKAGDGRLYLRNELNDEEEGFRLGMMQMGTLYLRTNSNGIKINIPDYFPQGSVGNITVRGRNTSEALIRGPFDELYIESDVYVSNAAVTYPPNTENLFKIINVAAERSSQEDQLSLPLSFDIRIFVGNQVRYITYPLNLLLASDGFLHLIGNEESININNAFFSSESGSLDMFGTVFSLDYATLLINEQHKDYKLNGYFFKYAADGSVISMRIENDGNTPFENISFNLSSDNPEDRTMLHVLSKLRYNRNLDDIPRNQQSSLLQDEFLQLAGVGLEGAIVMPFISPLENRLRKWLRLDYFSIKPRWAENAVRNYGFSVQSKASEEEHYVIEFGKNVLLNNFSINMGKYISRTVFLDYEFLIQQPTDVTGGNDLLNYHNFTVYYNLPYRFRFAYRLYIKPEDENNSHEIFIRRSFSFW